MNSNIKVIQPAGVLDGTQTHQFRGELDDIVNTGARVILIDLQNVTFMDSSGLAALVTAFKTVRSAGGKLCVCSVNQQVRMLFELTSMDRLFEIFADRDAFNETLNKV
ncbi:MAG: STAS domain-containing protein [Oculatellaceae cyanobacterium Prado106]|jgi:anti-anti-sigma factor|nr:STAS domain-containing protein [Oculatellaceae cyanobacterium Prado106]